MKQNKDNVKQRTTTKEKRKAELKEWMKIMKIKDCRLRAQKEFDVTERTVLKYLQEIRDEKTAIMRKKGDTA
jgi:predicted solute-binding protein